MFNERIVHLDFKGAPPRVDYLVSLFPYFRKWGATGLCLEWEDMLPFDGDYESLRCPYAYSPADVARILSAAKEAGLSVMPLVQTFGHLELLLKHKRFAKLREIQGNPQDICPSHPQALSVVLGLIDQVLRFHPGAPWIHLGGDEVWSLGICPKCSAFARKAGKPALYRKHMLPIVEHVRRKGVRALIWDDMLRHWPVGALGAIGRRAEPVVWRYRADVTTNLPEGMWERYDRALPRLWAASCFRGAGEADGIWPDFGNRVQNHDLWLQQSRKHKFAGILLTGWARYWHLAALCDTLPAGTPSLALCLAVLTHGGLSDALRHKTFARLGLGDFSFAAGQPEDLLAPPKGNFPGAEAFRLIARLQSARRLLAVAAFDARMCFPEYNGCRTDRDRLQRIARRCRQAERIVINLEPRLRRALKSLLFAPDVEEFIRAKVRTIPKEAGTLARRADALLKG